MKTETKIVWIAAIVQFVNIIDFMMVMPLGPDISKDLPITNSDIGLVCGCYTLAVGLSGLLCAKFLDAFDRKNAAIFTIAGLSIATLCAAFAWDLYSLTGARIIAGMFGGPAAAISLSMVSDAVPPERRGKAMAIVMGTFSVSSIAAVPFGLELARMGSWKSPFYAIFGLGIVVTFLITALTPPMKDHLKTRDEKGVSLIELVKNKYNSMAFLMMVTAMISSFLIIPNISAFFQENHSYPRELIGVLYMVGGVFSLILIQLGGRSSDKIGPIPTNVIGTILLVIFLYDGFMHQHTTPLIVVFVMFMGTVCFRNVSATAEASKLPKPHERAAFMSLLSSVQHFSNGIGALLSSAILISNPDGSLARMEWVALLSIIMALFQPYFLIKICRATTINTWNLQQPALKE